jgi:hypothetical protein
LKEDENDGSTQLPLPQGHGTRSAGVVWPLDGWPQLGLRQQNACVNLISHNAHGTTLVTMNAVFHLDEFPL